MTSSRERNTDSIASFQKANLVIVIASNETQNDDVVFFTLIVVNCANFDSTHDGVLFRMLFEDFILDK